jgi:hypothetical protein
VIEGSEKRNGNDCTEPGAILEEAEMSLITEPTGPVGGGEGQRATWKVSEVEEIQRFV